MPVCILVCSIGPFITYNLILFVCVSAIMLCCVPTYYLYICNICNWFCLGDAGIALYKLLVIQAFRPDRLTAMMNIFVSTIMGEAFMQYCEQELNLASIVEEEIESKTPVILASVVGFDASGRVDDLAAQLSKQCTAVAMGE